ncbi:UDP-glycosyltransferase 87A1-like [Senna tora]|uniref:UDP-glycosyltransferase 87A1-like n=1 Tax=Senna tora TaxID=362788 RepID=A0A834WX61_9FABA|nr:UDP-glycosyltransferase 87A1-like [Senna tora]
MEVIPPPTTACHVVAMPYPGRGHINPVLNFCKLLLSYNSDILVSFVVTEEWLGFIGGSEPKPHRNFRFITIPNVIPSELARAADLFGFFQAVMTKMEAPFEELLHRLEPPPTLIVYDTMMSWVVGVGNRRNISVASFWPMSASFFSVFHHYHLLEENGDYPVNALEMGEKRVDYFPGISPTRLIDFPLSDGSSRCREVLQLLSKSLSCLPKVQYLLFPSTYELEPQAIHVLKSELSLPIYHIGPAISYLTLPSTLSSDLSYFQWLDNQPNNSVLYISQGSFLSVSNAQIEEIAAGLLQSGVRFFWVARKETSRIKEMMMCGGKNTMGLVLEWCDQLRVLLHPAIGGFWSHCGWSSTMEGVFAGVPFLTFPIVMDQQLNSKMIVEDWKRDEIAELVKKFMDLNDDMRKRVKELRQMCQLSIAKGGSSESNINAFMRDITKRG